MVRVGVWVNVRLLALVVAAVTSIGCSLVLDTTPPQDAGPARGDCTSNADCDSDRCIGIEECIDNACVVVGAPADCDDGIDCTIDSCEAELCVHEPVDSLCGDPDEKCRPVDDGCAVPPTCSDTSDCEDGDLCNEPETCDPSGYCVISGPAVSCPLPGEIGCDSAWECESATGTCEVTDSDRTLCDSQPGTDQAACTDTVCQPDFTCENIVNPDFCATADTWMNCVVPVCDPVNAFADSDSGCVAIPNDDYCADASGTTECVESICIPRSVVIGTGVPTDINGCSTQMNEDACPSADAVCDRLSGNCVAVVSIICANDGTCDDGDPCNGIERCNLMTQTCESGDAVCTDVVGCEEEICAPGAGGTEVQCVFRPTDACYSGVAP